MKVWMTELTRLLSELLDYPVEHPGGMRRKILAALPSLTAEICQCSSREEQEALTKVGAALVGLEAYYKSAPLSVLQAAHAESFAEKPECNLHLTGHKYGGGPKQDKALAGLVELYRDYGFEPVGGHLPDYLPLLLEFMSAAPPEASAAIMDGFGPQLVGLAENISGSNTVYAQTGHCLAALTQCFATYRPASGAVFFR